MGICFFYSSGHLSVWFDRSACASNDPQGRADKVLTPVRVSISVIFLCKLVEKIFIGFRRDYLNASDVIPPHMNLDIY